MQPVQFSSVCTPADPKNGELLLNREAKRLPLLMHINHKSINPPVICLFYVKSIYVKSHIIVVKKVELDLRNGYI
ncbi:hypothetical protein DWG93_07775 [Escherichia coli]|nr:hypothetical protein [Escherichia coli]EFO1627679.1 hypothetical protein [Escherichia coli]